MTLEFPDRSVIEVMGEADILRAFSDDKRRGEFVYLCDGKHAYIAADNEGEGPFVLEYREGDNKDYVVCTRRVTKVEAQAAFLKYFHHDPSWKDDFDWRTDKLRPWWKFW